jgi:hypothetical protein
MILEDLIDQNKVWLDQELEKVYKWSGISDQDIADILLYKAE